MKGIVYDSWASLPQDQCSPRLVRYEPGNCTSYAILLVPIWGPGVCQDLGLDESEKHWLVAGLGLGHQLIECSLRRCGPWTPRRRRRRIPLRGKYR